MRKADKGIRKLPKWYEYYRTKNVCLEEESDLKEHTT